MSFEFLLVANPENRRATFFQQAVEAKGGTCRLLPWIDVLRGAEVDAPYVRIDSAGESWDVESVLLGREEPEDVGRIRGLDVANRALVGTMSRFRAEHFMTSPATIGAMFDKLETKRRLAAAGVLTPTTFGTTRTFDELRAIIQDRGRGRYFVKPRHGSSASGVIALTIRRDRVLAVTSVERVGDRLYNSLKLRRYESFADVAAVIDLLGREDELLIEDWVPKASAQGGCYDLRFVPIGGVAQHVVMRVSKSPMTNLHLGNSRGDVEDLRTRLGPKFEELREVACEAVSAFDGALYAGVDLTLTPDLNTVVTFEVNAFGDLLPGIHDAHGRSTYEAELDAFMGMRSSL